MISKRIAMTCLAASVALSPAGRAAADADGLVGGIVGGIVGGVIVNEANKNRNKRTYRSTTTRSSGVSSAVREERRDVQTSLNYFGFNAGPADGVLGRRSRTAISTYQAYLGYPPTGQLTEFEKTILIGAYHRAVAGGTEVSRMIARDPDGVKAVLAAQRDNATGTRTRRTTGYAGMPVPVSEAIDEIADSSDPSAEQLLQRSGFIQLADLNGDGNNDYIIDTALAGSSFWCNAVECKTLVFVSTAGGYVRNDLLMHDPTPASFECIGSSCRVRPQTELAVQPQQPADDGGDSGAQMASSDAADTEFSLPVFETNAERKSLSSHCSKVNLLTNANGGFITQANLSDPQFALQEQFCLARTYSIAAGEDLLESVKGVSAAQVEQQCAGFGKTLSRFVSSLSLKPADDVIRDVSSFVLNTSMSPAQLNTTGRICLATGYRKDDMDTAVGSALLLVALGQRPYAELLGHHLNAGYGATERKDLAAGWYQIALDALDSGATPVFAPQQADRPGLLRKASLGLSGSASTTGGNDASGTNGALPVFDIAN